MDYKLQARVSFITKTLHFSDEQKDNHMAKCFIREFGDKADEINHFAERYYKDLVNEKIIYRYNDMYITETLHNRMGLYAFFTGRKCIYVGKSTNLAIRIQRSFKVREEQSLYLLHKSIDTIKYMLISNKSDLDILELLYIAKYKPLFNEDCKSKEKSSILSFFDKDYISFSKFTTIPQIDCNINENITKKYYNAITRR